MTMNDMNDANNMKLMKGIAIATSIVMLLMAQLSAQGTAASTQGTKPAPQATSTPKPQTASPCAPPPVLLVEPDYKIGVGRRARGSRVARRDGHRRRGGQAGR
jgi:hypothetical protein